MKLVVGKDEWWPVYDLSETGWGPKAEITEAEWLDYKRIMHEFDELQKKLRPLYENGKRL